MTTVTDPRIVVGVDGTAASAAALAWAAAEASALRAPLMVVHVLDPRHRTAVYAPAPAEGRTDPDGVLARIKEIIDHAEAGRVEQVYEIGVPGLALVQRSRGARLLVLGSAAVHHRAAGEEYGHGPVLGPVARACVAPRRMPGGRRARAGGRAHGPRAGAAAAPRPRARGPGDLPLSGPYPGSPPMKGRVPMGPAPQRGRRVRGLSGWRPGGSARQPPASTNG